MKKTRLALLVGMLVSLSVCANVMRCSGPPAVVSQAGCPSVSVDPAGHKRCVAILNCLGKVCLDGSYSKDQREVRSHLYACLSKRSAMSCDSQTTYCLIADLDKNTLSIGADMRQCGKHVCASGKCLIFDLCESKYTTVAYSRPPNRFH